MQLKTANILRRGVFERLTDKVSEFSDVIGVGVNGGLGEISNFHTTGHSLSDRGESF